MSLQLFQTFIVKLESSKLRWTLPATHSQLRENPDTRIVMNISAYSVVTRTLSSTLMLTMTQLFYFKRRSRRRHPIMVTYVTCSALCMHMSPARIHMSIKPFPHPTHIPSPVHVPTGCLLLLFTTMVKTDVHGASSSVL